MQQPASASLPCMLHAAQTHRTFLFYRIISNQNLLRLRQTCACVSCTTRARAGWLAADFRDPPLFRKTILNHLGGNLPYVPWLRKTHFSHGNAGMEHLMKIALCWLAEPLQNAVARNNKTPKVSRYVGEFRTSATSQKGTNLLRKDCTTIAASVSTPHNHCRVTRSTCS